MTIQRETDEDMTGTSNDDGKNIEEDKLQKDKRKHD